MLLSANSFSVFIKWYDENGLPSSTTTALQRSMNVEYCSTASSDFEFGSKTSSSLFVDSSINSLVLMNPSSDFRKFTIFALLSKYSGHESCDNSEILFNNLKNSDVLSVRTMNSLIVVSKSCLLTAKTVASLNHVVSCGSLTEKSAKTICSFLYVNSFSGIAETTKSLKFGETGFF